MSRKAFRRSHPRLAGVFYAALLCGLLLTASALGATFTGAIDASDPTHDGRFQETGASSCATPKATPTVFSGGAHHYDAYTFTTGASQQCVTVTLNATSVQAGSLHVQAYLASFDPANIAANYLGDAGGNTGASNPLTFSFLVPAGSTYVVVVSERDADFCIGCTYSLDVTAAPIAVRFRTLSATRGKTGVIVRWRTAAEIETLGFNVFREVRGHRTRVNTRLIAARARASYTYVDRRGASFSKPRYWIQAVAVDGSTIWYGPTPVATS